MLGDGQEYGLTPGLNYAMFTVTCPSSEYWKIDYQLIFSMTTTSVNPVPDTIAYIVLEYSGDSPDNLVQRKTTFTLEKRPFNLYLNNLVSVPASQSSTTVPKTQYRCGEAIRLLWDSNGGRFSLYSGGGSTPIWTGPDTSYTVTGGTIARHHVHPRGRDGRDAAHGVSHRRRHDHQPDCDRALRRRGQPRRGAEVDPDRRRPARPDHSE